MAASETGLRRLSLICIPTVLQDQGVAFYEALGFEKRTDTPYGNGDRWIEMYLPGEPTGIALAPPPPHDRTVTPMVTGITLTTADIDATHAALRERKVDVDHEVMRPGDPVPPLFFFRDPSGHTLMVVQQAP